MAMKGAKVTILLAVITVATGGTNHVENFFTCYVTILLAVITVATKRAVSLNASAVKSHNTACSYHCCNYNMNIDVKYKLELSHNTACSYHCCNQD